MLSCRRLAIPFLLISQLSIAAIAQEVRPDQTIELLVSTVAGAPTADELVNYYRGAQLTPPPLQGLTVGSPLKIAYLMPLRARGDFLAHLQAHPDSARAQLERYVVVIYPDGSDLSVPLAALLSDPYVWPPMFRRFGIFQRRHLPGRRLVVQSNVIFLLPIHSMAASTSISTWHGSLLAAMR